MASRMELFASVLCLLAVFGSINAGPLLFSPHNAGPPKFSDQYTVSGVLSLPYAEIEEPFEALYDVKNNRSRIDYYDSMVVTIQRGDKGAFGISYKLAPMTTEKVTNKDMCFQVNGTKDAKVGTQTIFPDLTGFTMVRTENYENINCSVWQMVNKVGFKKSTYTMWVNNVTQVPVRYEMMGYDSLLGSHYDKYYISYKNYQANPVPEKKFEVPPNMTCGGFPGPGAAESNILMNPMREYIHNDDHHIHQMFDDFKKVHSKDYDVKEHAQRITHFRHNVRFIHSKNRQSLGYSLAVNHLADKSDTEIKFMRGYHYTPGHHGGLPFDKSKYDLKSLPDHVDWRLYGAVTPVKDQAVCGSCWSFGTTGTIEGAYFIKTGNLVRLSRQSGNLVRLSQQELMDCSWGEGNNACDGGEDFRSYQWIMKNGGLTSEEQYGQYLGQDGRCHSKKVKIVTSISGYVNVTPYDQDALRMAIAKEGPVSVGIDAAHKSLSFYANGVYYEPKCGNKPDDLDHAVLAIGYGTMNGQAYWLVKNSWSTYWGNDGYVLMSQKNNNCGVATAATYVII